MQHWDTVVHERSNMEIEGCEVVGNYGKWYGGEFDIEHPDVKSTLPVGGRYKNSGGTGKPFVFPEELCGIIVNWSGKESTVDE